jgi:hypothetical protein
MSDKEARTFIQRIVMDYDRLAKLAEVQLIQEAIGRKRFTICVLFTPAAPSPVLALPA